MRWGRATFEQRRKRQAWQSAARQAWPELLRIVFGLMAAAVVVAVWPFSDPSFNYVIVGVLLASAFWIPFLFLILRTNASTMGAWGEGYTRDMLRRHARHWATLNDMPLERGNIDHVAVTDNGVLAMETKFRGATGGGTDRHQRDLNQVSQNARTLRLLLRSRLPHLTIAVTPVLVLWGPGATVVEHGWVRHGDVDVIPGPEPDPWIATHTGGPFSRAQIREIHDSLADYQRTRDRHEIDKRRRRAGSRRSPLRRPRSEP